MWSVSVRISDNHPPVAPSYLATFSATQNDGNYEYCREPTAVVMRTAMAGKSAASKFPAVNVGIHLQPWDTFWGIPALSTFLDRFYTQAATIPELPKADANERGDLSPPPPQRHSGPALIAIIRRRPGQRPRSNKSPEDTLGQAPLYS